MSADRYITVYVVDQFMLAVSSRVCNLFGTWGLFIPYKSLDYSFNRSIAWIVCVHIFIISKKVSSKLGRQNEFYNAKLFQWINQSLGGIKEVKILQREKYFIDSYRTNYKK